MVGCETFCVISLCFGATGEVREVSVHLQNTVNVHDIVHNFITCVLDR